jgi:peptidyl-tRNA hydrolase
MDPADYVLESFLPSELNNLKSILDRAVETAQVFINKGLDESMNQFNGSILD